MKKEVLKINFVDFWPNLVKTDNYFYHLLREEYDVLIDETKPDLLFHSVDYAKKEEHKLYDGLKTKKIFFTGENVQPNYEECHASLTFLPNKDTQNYRLPLWALFINWFDVPYNKKRDQSYLINKESLLENKKNLKINNKFCYFPINFLY